MPYETITGPPSGGARKGALALMTYVVNRWSVLNSGIYNPRDICGNPWPNVSCSLSAHLEGRACDFGIRPFGAPVGTEISAWLIMNRYILGVEEIIWNRRVWSGNNPFWRTYVGRSDHSDHIHVTLSKVKADSLTLGVLNLLNPGGTSPATPQIQQLEENMQRVVIGKDRKAVFVTDWITKRWLRTAKHRDDILRVLGQTSPMVVDVDSVDLVAGVGMIPQIRDAAGNVSSEGWEI